MAELNTSPSQEIGLKENIAEKPETMTKIFWEKFSKINWRLQVLLFCS